MKNNIIIEKVDHSPLFEEAISFNDSGNKATKDSWENSISILKAAVLSVVIPTLTVLAIVSVALPVTVFKKRRRSLR